MLLGVFMYQSCFTKFELRTLTYFSVVFSMIGSAISYVMIKRINIEYGISDFALMCFTHVLSYPLMMAFSVLPSLVLFQKLTPDHVEATMMAFYASVVNTSNSMLGEMTGVWVNEKFIGVSKDNMDRYIYVWYVGVATMIVQIFFIRLIPVQADVDRSMAWLAE